LCHGDKLPTSYVTTTYKIRFGRARCTHQAGTLSGLGSVWLQSFNHNRLTTSEFDAKKRPSPSQNVRLREGLMVTTQSLVCQAGGSVEQFFLDMLCTEAASTCPLCVERGLK